MRKNQWAVSSNGPDWTDVETLIRAIGALHSAHVAVILSQCGIGSSGGISVVASALFERLPGSQLPPSVQVKAEWPNATHATLEGVAFAQLYALDYEISRVYEQSSLWK